MTTECTRSHPHELMDDICKEKAVSAKAINGLAHAQAEITKLRAELEAERGKVAMLLEAVRLSEPVMQDAYRFRDENSSRYKAFMSIYNGLPSSDYIATGKLT